MAKDTINNIRHFIDLKNIHLPYNVAKDHDIKAVEARLGLILPDLLRSVLTRIGNGGFGPGYGLIGTSDGYCSEFGDIASTYWRIRDDWKRCGDQWPRNLILFCEFGCNIFACVQANNQSQIHLLSSGERFKMNYDLDTFFNLWVAGHDFFDDLPPHDIDSLINPFLAGDN
ncbi:SMI1/KNR4 family protein [Planctomycetota bacterium]|nr:SMI1/KNR4 family protein [Planctomycetota bacterium]